MSFDISPESGFLIGLSISLILYGMYCTLFALTLYTRRMCESNSGLVTGGIIALFILCTVIMAFHIATCYDGFILHAAMDQTSGYFVDPFQPRQDWFLARDIPVFISNLIVESLLIWRLYMVWAKNWKILIFPVIAMTGILCGGVASIVMEFIVYLSSSIERAGKLILILKQLSPIAWHLILANDFFCTVFIVWKLWRIARTAEGRATERLASPAMSAIIESGALCTSTMLCMTIFGATGLYGVRRVFMILITVITGIASTSIVFRLNLIAVRKTSRSIQNDVSVVQLAPPSATFGDFGPNEPRMVHSGVVIETIPPIVFARPSLPSFIGSTCGDTSPDQTNNSEREIEKSPNYLLPLS